MARFIAFVSAIALMASGAGTAAAPPKSPTPQASPQQPLIDGVRAVGRSLAAQGQSAQASPMAQPGDDHDQGDDHASLIAIYKVCTHNNPSAQRSAICPRPNSPP